MEGGLGAEVSEKIRSAIKAKLMEIGVYVDEELPDYVMVMVANKRSKEQMDDDLQLFLGKHTSLFTTWLHQVLQRLQEVTVGNLGSIKRKILEDTKKKKKVKQEQDDKELKKKIKVEPEDDKPVENSVKNSESNNTERRASSIDDDCNSITSSQHNENVEPKQKEKEDLGSKGEQIKKTKTTLRFHKPQDDATSSVEVQKANEKDKATRRKSNSLPSPGEDLEDEDCINIRTDGELLDAAEEVNTEESSKQSRDKETEVISKSVNENTDNKVSSDNNSPIRPKDKNKFSDSESYLVNNKNPSPPPPSPPKANVKVLDARELLNRKKAAKQSQSAKSRSRERSRSTSRSRKRKSDERDKRGTQELDKESSSRKVSRDDDRERRGRGDERRDRDVHSSKRKDHHSLRRTHSDRDGKGSKRRDGSSDPPTKRAALDRTSRNRNDEWNTNRATDSCKGESEFYLKNKGSEDGRKRGLSSRVVSRPLEPEEEVETPVPSVVKITPRPRRPPSQQPSSTLIMKAISEANKSLATVPPRTESTQRARNEPVFTRNLHQLERIPPEKIAVSITNPLALQADNAEKKSVDEISISPKSTEAQTKKLPKKKTKIKDSVPSDKDPVDQNDIKRERKDKRPKEEEELQHESPEPVLELEPNQDLDAFDEQIEEMSDPQFVVTLNGYDPDGLYSHSELDPGEEEEEEGIDTDDWLKATSADDNPPVSTSTPDQEASSPLRGKERKRSPIIIMNTPINHSNLIEVELVKAKSTERCKYWPACRLADKCTYYHPTKPCKMFPNCKFADGCLYIHPQCKFNALCTRKDCVFAHTSAHTPSQPAAVPKVKALYAANAPLPCKFYPNCTNVNCQYAHPTRACRFGFYCTKKDCPFSHGQGAVAPVDKLKWTRSQQPTT